MKPLDPSPALGADDDLSLWVGRVARTHALLEYGVDNVHRFLMRRDGREADGRSAKGFDQLVTESSNLLRKSDCDEAILAAGASALRAARKATGKRNRIVHDMWLPDPLPDDSLTPRWTTFRRSGDLQESYNAATSNELAMVIDAHTLLLRTRVRVSGLFMALHESWPGGHDRTVGLPDESKLARCVALMSDRFILHANGDFEIT